MTFKELKDYISLMDDGDCDDLMVVDGMGEEILSIHFSHVNDESVVMVDTYDD